MLVKYGDFFIIMLIEDMVHHCKWRLMVVYSSTDDRKRAQQLGILTDHIASYPEPCLLMGYLMIYYLILKRMGVICGWLQV